MSAQHVRKTSLRVNRVREYILEPHARCRLYTWTQTMAYLCVSKAAAAHSIWRLVTRNVDLFSLNGNVAGWRSNHSLMWSKRFWMCTPIELCFKKKKKKRKTFPTIKENEIKSRWVHDFITNLATSTRIGDFFTNYHCPLLLLWRFSHDRSSIALHIPTQKIMDIIIQRTIVMLWKLNRPFVWHGTFSIDKADIRVPNNWVADSLPRSPSTFQSISFLTKPTCAWPNHSPKLYKKP